MFYANFVLAKKGPLARVWLAAHWEKKLSKAHVFETDLQSSVDNIISPKVKIALRTSGHLLLGVVRIYSRKAKYLLADCTEALIKIKMAFRPDVVDLPLDNQKAAAAAITLPELQEWDAMLNNLGSFDINTFNNNVCRVEDITMKEDIISNRFLSDDNFFGDTPFGEITEREILRDESFHEASFHAAEALSKTLIDDDKDGGKDDTTIAMSQSNLELAMHDPMMGGTGFGAGEGLDFLEGFGMEGIVEVPPLDLDASPKLDPLEPLDETMIKEHLDIDQIGQMSGIEEISAIPGNQIIDDDEEEPESELLGPEDIIDVPTVVETETTLFSRDTEALNLEPIEINVGKTKHKKRKRKLIVDQEKIILNEAMKQQIQNDEDIIKTAVVAPPTRTRLLLLESSTRTCFTQPPIIQSKKRRLGELYELNMTFEKPEDFVLPSSQDQDDDVYLEKVTEVFQPIEDMPADTDDIPEEIEPLDSVKPADDVVDDADTALFEQPQIETDLEMKAVEEELMNEEGIPIAPAFELETIDKTVGDDIDEDNLYILHNTDDVEEEEVDKRWSKRTRQTLRILQKGLSKKQPISFTKLTRKSDRKQAAYTFYTLLILSKELAVEIKQEESFGDILIDRGTKFDSHV